MPNNTSHNRKRMLLRSMLFVTAHNEKFVSKAIESEADALIIDMEDSVPEDSKSLARELTARYLADGVFAGKQVFVRTNPIDSAHFLRDIDASMHPDILGIMPPKIQSREDLVFIDKLLTQKENEYGIEHGHFRLAPLVETASAVLNLADIVRGNERIVAIVFGGEDYLNDLEGTHGNPPIAFNVPKSLIAMAARSLGISPIDTPYLDPRDIEGFIAEKAEAFELGFAGSLLINPKQIAPANACFTPNEDEVRQARDIIDACIRSEAEGAGCAMLGKTMIGPPMQRRAKRIMSFMEMLP